MITMDELLCGAVLSELSPEIQENLNDLLIKINIIRTKWGKPMYVTSGFRTMKHHLEIYKAKGITDPKRIPMKSNHLYGKAVDISDPTKILQKWCKDNVYVLETIGLWMEDFSVTKTWCHFQTVPPASGKRWFMP
jgi:hypothetical protein